jgi:PST family polysaccharide transporter
VTAPPDAASAEVTALSNAAAGTSSSAGVERFAQMGLLTSGATVALGIVRSKLVAVKLGPLGVGIVAEVTQLLMLAGVVATVASSPALLTWIAESFRDNDGKRLERGLGTSLVLAALLGGTATLVCVVVAPWLLPSDWPINRELAVGLSGVSIVLYAMAACVLTVHIGASDLKAISLSSLVGGLLGTVALVALVWFGGLEGQFFAIAVGGAFALAVPAALLKRRKPPVVLRPAWDAAFARQTFTIGATTLVSGYVAQGLLSAIRFILEHEGGRTEGAVFNGNFQAAYAIGTTYFQAVLQGVGQFYFPRYAAARTSDELTTEVHAAAKFVLRYTPMLVFLAISYRDIIVHMLYSDKFRLASAMLGFMFAADILKGASWSYAGPLPMRGRVRAFLVTELSAFVLGVPLYWLAIHFIGPQAVGVGMLVNTGIYLVIAMAVTRRSCGVRVDPKHLVAALGLALLAAGYTLMLARYQWLRWPMTAAIVGMAAATGAFSGIIAWLRVRLRPTTAA